MTLFHKKSSSIEELLVRIIGLEPTRLAAPDPKSGMSTNFTISANCECKYRHTFELSNKKFKKFKIFFFVFLAVNTLIDNNGYYKRLRSKKQGAFPERTY